MDVVISTLAVAALNLQPGIAEAAKEAGVKLFVPSEFGGQTEGTTEGFYGTKASIQERLKAINIPYAIFHTGPWADYIWIP